MRGLGVSLCWRYASWGVLGSEGNSDICDLRTGVLVNQEFNSFKDSGSSLPSQPSLLVLCRAHVLMSMRWVLRSAEPCPSLFLNQPSSRLRPFL